MEDPAPPKQPEPERKAAKPFLVPQLGVKVDEELESEMERGRR